MSRRLILQQARGLRPWALPLSWVLRFQVLIHSRWGFFSPFPHGTTSLSSPRSISLMQRWSFADSHGIPRAHSYSGQSVKLVMLSGYWTFASRRSLPFRSPLLRESLLLSFPLATKMFQFARLSLACPWIQQQFERLTYSGISGSMLIFNSPKHFVAYYALPRLWVPRLNRRIGKIGCYHIALYRLSSRVGDKRTRTADIRRRVNHRLSGPPTDSTIEANDRQ
ncbi:hypothetical protein Tco_1322389 [Tanacetum coccineum]